MTESIEKPKLNGLPKVLLVGAEDTEEIFSKKELYYESNKLNIKFIDNSEEINKHLSDFNPDSIITFGENFYKYPELSGVSVDFRRGGSIWKKKTITQVVYHTTLRCTTF